jgi:hypothetical protein
MQLLEQFFASGADTDALAAQIQHFICNIGVPVDLAHPDTGDLFYPTVSHHGDLSINAFDPQT